MTIGTSSELGSLGVDELVALVLSQQDLIAFQSAHIADQERRIAALEAQLGLGGPPKAGGSRSPNIKANKPVAQNKTRKKRDLHFCRKRETATTVVDHMPDCCPDCGRGLIGGGPKRSRQVIDIKIEPVEITEHVLHSRYCGVCKKRVVANPDLSAYVSRNRRFGHNLASLIATLSCNGRMPIRTIKSTLQSLYGLRISEGAIIDILQDVAEAGAPVVAPLKDEARNSPLLHADESSWRENGQNGYLWLLATLDIRIFEYDRHRSYEVAKRIVGEYFGTLITDFYYAYNQLACRHQRCWVHFLRHLHELRDGAESDVDAWIDAVIAVWRKAADFQMFCWSKPKFGANVYDRRRKRKAFERELYTLAEPYLECDPKVVRQTTLSKRIAMFLTELFTFVEYPEVPHHNNPAEQAIRPAVIARKISGGTRSPLGTQTKTTLMSLFATWNLRGLDPLQQCRQLLTASP
ncbi:MAG TPA: IS66 family transposase [Capsulimonadaceae bacterium]